MTLHGLHATSLKRRAAAAKVALSLPNPLFFLVGFSPPSFFRVLEPWDLLRGRDVFRDADLLKRELADAFLQHWAPNCATFSRAREIPLVGVANPPKPIRSELHPGGIPDEVKRMSNKQRKRLETDTEMADLAANSCLEALESGRIFTLEHPFRSLARHLPSWKKLERAEGVSCIEYSTCMFEGSRRKKRQVLIPNSDSFIKEIGRECKGSRHCERTGQPHLKWKPLTSGSKVIQFTTGEEREYPIGFCRSYARAAKSLLDGIKRFVEIFSGPNAPLSGEVAMEFGEVLRGCRLSKEKGIKNELSSIAELISSEVKGLEEQASDFRPYSETPTSAVQAEGLPNRLAAVKAGKQPSFGKRSQLIPDGTRDPLLHLAAAIKLQHPFEGLEALKEDHVRAIQFGKRSPLDSNKERLRKLAQMRLLSRDAEIQERQACLELQASENAKQLLLRPRVALMEKLGKLLKIEDPGVPLLCVKGMTIVGPALTSPFFTDFQVPPAAIHDGSRTGGHLYFKKRTDH